MVIHVRNFGKIKSADINLANLVVFVGDNDSGKSCLMQLIYGVYSFLREGEVNEVLDSFAEQLSIENDKLIINGGESYFYSQLHDKINKVIDINKNTIITRFFKTKELTIEHLSVEFDSVEDSFSIVKAEDESGYQIRRGDNVIHRMVFSGSSSGSVHKILKQRLLSFVLSQMIGINYDFSFRKSMPSPALYVPEFHSSLNVLYPAFLSTKYSVSGVAGAQNVIVECIDKTFDEHVLTEPVYNFLSFLAEYRRNSFLSDSDNSLISFIEHIVGGSYENSEDGVYYHPTDCDRSVPMYLASSLVSELLSFYKIVSGTQGCPCVLYDGLGNGLHPTKQSEVVRLIIRMVNAGYRMVVSTHSDTVAAVLNNFLVMSNRNERNQLITQLKYEEVDLFKEESISVYQLIADDDGKTVVEELSNHLESGIGFEFDSFSKVSDKIYAQTVLIHNAEFWQKHLI